MENVNNVVSYQYVMFIELYASYHYRSVNQLAPFPVYIYIYIYIYMYIWLASHEHFAFTGILCFVSIFAFFVFKDLVWKNIEEGN